MDLTWLLELIKSILFFVDGIIYSFILTVYNLLNDIANTTLFNDGIIDGVKDKVFALVGVFMLFKVSFSLLTYVVNPDSFADKTKGFSKLITNIIITLVLLVSIKFIFNQAMEIQSIILKDGTLQKIFSSENYSYSSIDAGNTMALETFKAFYHPNTDNCSSNNPDDCVAIAFGDDGTSLNAYNTAKTANSFTLYKNAVGVNAKNSDGDYIMTYTPIISTVCGVVILLLLITFCFDVALRSVKLGFLEMLAPIPIIARIEPKGSKMFDKWVGECISTYLNLFIRLLAIYFAVFMIQQLPNLTMVNAVTGSEEGIGLFTKVFIVMGALMFAKQLPKLISDITGAKLDGKFTLNPLKKMSEVPLVGKPLATGIGFAGRTAGTVAGVAGAGALALGGMVASPVASALKKGAKGTGNWINNMTGGVPGKIGNWVSNQYHNIGDAVSSNDTLARATDKIATDYQNTKNKIFGSTLGVAGAALGIQTAADKFDESIKKLNDVSKIAGDTLKTAVSEAMKNNNIKFKDTEGHEITVGDYKIRKARLDALKNMDITNMSDEKRYNHFKLITDEEAYVGRNEAKIGQEFININQNSDAYASVYGAELKNLMHQETQSNIAKFNNEVAKLSATEKRQVFDTVAGEKIKTEPINSIKDFKQATTDAASVIQASPEYAKAQAQKAAMPSKPNR